LHQPLSLLGGYRVLEHAPGHAVTARVRDVQVDRLRQPAGADELHGSQLTCRELLWQPSEARAAPAARTPISPHRRPKLTICGSCLDFSPPRHGTCLVQAGREEAQKEDPRCRWV